MIHHQKIIPLRNQNVYRFVRYLKGDLSLEDYARITVFEICEINNNGVSSVSDGVQNPYQYFHLTTHT